MRLVPPSWRCCWISAGTGRERKPLTDGRRSAATRTVPSASAGCWRRGTTWPAPRPLIARADELGHRSGASNLGVLLEQRGDLDGAEAAYRRADERGDTSGSFNLWRLLADRGDLAGAAAAFSRADQRGDAAGATNLGMLLEQRGDFAGAEAAYRRADQRGDANGAFNLGALLERNDVAEAEAAYRRAAERGRPELADMAQLALSHLHADR